MVVYRLKHIPTGLYYRPSTEVKIMVGGKNYYVKTNLSKNGKIYSMKPSLSWIEDGFYSHKHCLDEQMLLLLSDGETSMSSYGNRYGKKLYPYVESEWVIEEC